MRDFLAFIGVGVLSITPVVASDISAPACPMGQKPIRVSAQAQSEEARRHLENLTVVESTTQDVIGRPRDATQARISISDHYCFPETEKNIKISIKIGDKLSPCLEGQNNTPFLSTTNNKGTPMEAVRLDLLVSHISGSAAEIPLRCRAFIKYSETSTVPLDVVVRPLAPKGTFANDEPLLQSIIIESKTHGYEAKPRGDTYAHDTNELTGAQEYIIGDYIKKAKTKYHVAAIDKATHEQLRLLFLTHNVIRHNQVNEYKEFLGIE